MQKFSALKKVRWLLIDHSLEQNDLPTLIQLNGPYHMYAQFLWRRIWHRGDVFNLVIVLYGKLPYRSMFPSPKLKTKKCEMNKTHKGVIEAWLNQSAWQRCHETEELKPGDMIFWAKDCKSMKKVTKLRNWKQATPWLEPSLLFTVHWTSVCQGDCCSASKCRCRTSRIWSNVLRSQCIGFTHLASQMCHQRQA